MPVKDSTIEPERYGIQPAARDMNEGKPLDSNVTKSALNLTSRDKPRLDSRNRPSAAQDHIELHSEGEISTWIGMEEIHLASREQRRRAKRSGDDEPCHLEDAGTDNCDESHRLQSVLKRAPMLESPRVSGISAGHQAPLKRSRMQKASTPLSTMGRTDHNAVIPSCAIFLDNCEPTMQLESSSLSGESDVWACFKFDIVCLTHTLQLTGWSKLPLELSSQIKVKRLSGAMTNAVYVVTPPNESFERSNSQEEHTHIQLGALLLRIYGTQVENLIDRTAELRILERLARKRLGPRVLGTFVNGRFEEYLNSTPLTPGELRNAENSQQIARRLCELHQSIDLTSKERQKGPFVWLNWDKWVQRVEHVVTWLDREVQSMESGSWPESSQAWRSRGYVCGVRWQYFKDTVEKYRKWLEDQYGGFEKMCEDLVFAHNDTHHGNILRMIPETGTKVLPRAELHNQLVIIDCEYSNANPPGLELANHFTEWCYDYYNELKPYTIDSDRYPTLDEQDRFVRAYVRHRSHSDFEMRSSSAQIAGRLPSTTYRASFNVLDATDMRVLNYPSSSSTTINPSESAVEDTEVRRLIRETRLWRVANSAQWIAWALVQAKIPGIPESNESFASIRPEQHEPGRGSGSHEVYIGCPEMFDNTAKSHTSKSRTMAEEEHQNGEFDYLSYAQQRSLLFWGDLMQMGLVEADRLPDDLRSKVKIVLN